MSHEDRVYVDFMKTDKQGRLLLVCIGTKNDISRLGIVLSEGKQLRVYSDDADDQKKRDDLLAEGTVHFNSEEQQWVLALDQATIRHESDEA